ncbi:MAG: hypothetical protein JXQ87_03325 [Bacteroidia bacterium]
MNNFWQFQNNEWLIFLPALVGFTYYVVVKAFKLKKAMSRSNQVNAFGVGLILGLPVVSYLLHYEVSYFLFALLLLGVVNFLDDLFEVHYVWRLMLQFVACSFLLMEHQLFYSYWGPVLLFLCVGFLNAFNFMDGINGYVGTYSFALILSLVVLTDRIEADTKLLGWSTIVFLMVFLVLNFRTKALAWLGDTGSIALGLIILHLFFSIFNGYKLYLFLVFGSVFIIDAGYTLFHRNFKGKNVFERHREHLYQQITNHKNFKAYWWIFTVCFLQFVVNILLIQIEKTILQAYVAGCVFILMIIGYALLKRYVVKMNVEKS